MHVLTHIPHVLQSSNARNLLLLSLLFNACLAQPLQSARHYFGGILAKGSLS